MRCTVARSTLALGLLVALVSPIASVPDAEAASGPVVQVISAGNAPRSPLRIAVPDGASAQATMEMSESLRQSSGGSTINSVDTPPFTVGITTSAGAASPAGNIPISYRYSDVNVVNNGSLRDAQLSQYKSALAPLGSLTGTGTLTPRNQLLDSKIAGTQGLDPTTAQLLSQLSNQLDSLSAPFPREAVGVGARWRVTSVLHVSGIDAHQVIEYALRQREGDQIVLDVKMTQTAPRQRADLPNIPRGTNVQISKWNVSGAGNATWNLARPGLPVASVMHAAGTQSFDVRSKSQRGTLTQNLTTDVKLTS